MIAFFELIALCGLIWGLVLAAQFVAKHQKLYYTAHPSLVYVKDNKVYTNKSVWRFPFTSPVITVHQFSHPLWVRGDVLTQFGVVEVDFALHARINDPRLASTFTSCNEFDAERMLFGYYAKIQAVLQSAINEAGNADMSYTPQLHTTTYEKMQEFCNRHGLELEEISFAKLEIVGQKSVNIETQAPVLQQFNLGHLSAKE